MLKKCFAAALCIGLIFALGACGKKDEQPEAIQTDFAKVPRATKFLTDTQNPEKHPVRVEMEVLDDGSIVKVEIGMTGGDYYINSRSADMGSVSVIFKGNEVYTISHRDKSAVITEKSLALSQVNPLESLYASEESLQGATVSTGVETLQGKTYEYEEFNDGQKAIRLLFDGEICKAIYTIADGRTEIVVIDAYDQNVPEEKFKIPQGYTIEK